MDAVSGALGRAKKMLSRALPHRQPQLEPAQSVPTQ
jgi:hypothetical protein